MGGHFYFAQLACGLRGQGDRSCANVSLTTAQLKEKYREVFGEESRSNHKQFLFRRIAWRIQANAWGGLSERARRRALEIANDADLRIRAPRNFLREPLDNSRTTDRRLKPSLDPRLPLPGTPLIRRFQGKDIIVHVRPDGGFECNGRIRGAESGLQLPRRAARRWRVLDPQPGRRGLEARARAVRRRRLHRGQHGPSGAASAAGG